MSEYKIRFYVIRSSKKKKIKSNSAKRCGGTDECVCAIFLDNSYGEPFKR